MAQRPPPLEPPADRESIGSSALEKVDVARRAVGRAGAALDVALGEIRKAPRADKVTASDAVRAAFEDLRRAMLALSDLEAIEPDGQVAPAGGPSRRDDERHE